MPEEYRWREFREGDGHLVAGVYERAALIIWAFEVPDPNPFPRFQLWRRHR